MLFYIAEGRIGNQIFQYAFLKTISYKLKQKVISFGFDELLEIFDEVDIFVIKNPFYPIKDKKKLRTIYWWYNYIFYRMGDFLDSLSDKGLISCIEHEVEEGSRETDEKIDETWKLKTGLIKKFIFVKPGYFQSERFFSPDLLKIKIKERFMHEAYRFIENRVPRDSYKVFVHFRSGDYKNFKIFGKDVVPPLSYYKSLIKWFEENRKNCFFIILTDESNEAENLFSGISNKVISKNHPGVDMSIMSLCEGGILSPSSFSWWGAYFMKKRDIVFAPKYWLGWKSKIEYPHRCFPSFAKEIEIDETGKHIKIKI